MNDAPALLFDRVSFAYGGDPVLEDVSFSVPRGEYLVCMGPNGGGKTTLLFRLGGELAARMSCDCRVANNIAVLGEYFRCTSGLTDFALVGRFRDR